MRSGPYFWVSSLYLVVGNTFQGVGGAGGVGDWCCCIIVGGDDLSAAGLSLFFEVILELDWNRREIALLELILIELECRRVKARQ